MWKGGWADGTNGPNDSGFKNIGVYFSLVFYFGVVR
jgi:hypothetical protein